MLKRPAPSEIPEQPGAYLFRDASGDVIYAGKAKSLRKRIASYFAKALPSRTMRMMSEAESLDWMIAKNEAEAILLEFNLIKEHRPRFNVLLKDDKSFPFLAVTMGEEWPRPAVMRGRLRKGVRYFGPYAHTHAIRETLDSLLRTFPLRTCSNSKLKSHAVLGKPCLYFHIERCAGPCVGAVTNSEYLGLVDDFCKFLDGDDRDVTRRLESEMAEASKRLEFEVAARKRDELASIRKVIERQQAISARSENFDAIAVADDEIDVSIQVFSVRRGRLVGRRGYLVEKAEDLSRADLIATLLEQVYGYAEPSSNPASEKEQARPIHVPRQILVEDEPAGIEACEAFLASLRGGSTEIKVPQRGEKREFMATVRQNAIDALARHKLRRSADHGSRSRALASLQDSLGLPEAPLRIECYDISNTGGDEIVASMVVLEDGLPKPRDYRRFKIREQSGQDDYAAMAEVIRRRFTAYIEEMQNSGDSEPAEGTGSTARSTPKPKKFAYRPSLVLIDGGPGQLNAATGVLDELGIEGIAVAGLAKRFEEVYLPGQAEPVRIERGSTALHILQRVRDEAHRFAISYHRKLRGKKMTRSALDGIAGVGDVRKKQLMRQFGSVKRLKEATLEEIKAVPGVPESVATAIHEALSSGSSEMNAADQGAKEVGEGSDEQ
ncbi:MAG: excinuclease ABC subunit C [Acidobacteria bacterium]|nr:MAG: excinuclease ABC subunit C [Acidobacteriota bacterium]